ncbi:hypothetical protein DL96DRAFT_1619486 [Flagelloscypha sp. PMI_526]|nr:hypothetical protein DL96DRAFT_1619486 [Flagelloscypha sp. PMI_526]
MSFQTNNASSNTGLPSLNLAPPTKFKPPAHKHAHIIHSIPPKEKSTRTLIIDQSLWCHARTRFAQARAELGMTDRTGGPSSSNYQHRLRPENYDEDEEASSDAENDLQSLRAQIPGSLVTPPKQDLQLARALRLRSEAVERVVISMLTQVPTYHPPPDDDFVTPPSSPKLSGPTTRDPNHPHSLPNGVRMRVALGTLINDLFARQAPTAPPSITFGASASDQIAKTAPPDPWSTQDNINLPHVLQHLADFSQFRKESISRLATDVQAQAPGQNETVPHQIQSYYAQGTHPKASSVRCSSHLRQGCDICVSAKRKVTSKTMRSQTQSVAITSSSAFSRATGGQVPQGGVVTGWLDGPGIGSGLGHSGPVGTVLRRLPPPSQSLSSPEKEELKALETNIRLSRFIPRFLRLSALIAIELGLEARDDLSTDEPSLSPSLSPDMRVMSGSNRHLPGLERVPPLPPPALPLAFGGEQQSMRLKKLYEFAFRPSESWYMLLAGLLTRAALQGYLAAGWTGYAAADVLLSFGTEHYGSNNNMEGFVTTASSTFESELDIDDLHFEEFEPDDLPPLQEAVLLLFPSLRGGSDARLLTEEERYKTEMSERLKRFFDIPSRTLNLEKHMEDLADIYPAEPVERAAVRYMEALTKWRGKPELETHKKNPPRKPPLPSSPSAIAMESIIHTSPTNTTPPSRPARLSIEHFFLPPYLSSPPRSKRSDGDSSSGKLSSNKRSRPPNSDGQPPSKRLNL